MPGQCNDLKRQKSWYWRNYLTIFQDWQQKDHRSAMKIVIITFKINHQIMGQYCFLIGSFCIYPAPHPHCRYSHDCFICIYLPCRMKQALVIAHSSMCRRFKLRLHRRTWTHKCHLYTQMTHPVFNVQTHMSEGRYSCGKMDTKVCLHE